MALTVEWEWEMRKQSQQSVKDALVNTGEALSSHLQIRDSASSFSGSCPWGYPQGQGDDSVASVEPEER